MFHLMRSGQERLWHNSALQNVRWRAEFDSFFFIEKILLFVFTASNEYKIEISSL